jgi:hypothetical protein
MNHNVECEVSYERDENKIGKSVVHIYSTHNSQSSVWILLRLTVVWLKFHIALCEVGVFIN